MDKVIELKYYEKLALRLFAAWCLATVFVSIPVNGDLYVAGVVARINMRNIFIYLFAIFVMATGIDFLITYKCKKINIHIDTILYVFSILLFGVNSVFQVKDVYLASIVILGIVICMIYVINKYGFWLTAKEINMNTAVRWIVLIAIFTFVLMGSLTVLRYKTYRTSTFDFGIFAQMFYNMKNSFLPMTTCERNELLSHFSVHVSPIFYFILPIYCIFPYNETLIIVQLLFIISGVIPLVLICKNRKLSNLVILAVGFVYLLSPVLFGGLFYDFHENKFLTTLILWLMYFVEKDKSIGVYIFSILVLMVKEDAAIYVACVGLYILATKEGKKKLNGLYICIMSVIWFFMAYSWLNSSGDGAMTDRYSNFIVNEDGGVFEIIDTIIKNPAYFFKQLLTTEKLENMLWVLVPLMFMPFRVKSMKELILLIPFLVINLMPSYKYQYDISHQYYYGSLALMLYLVVVNMKQKRKFENVSVSICMVIASLIMFTSVITDKLYYFEDYNEDKVKNEKIAEVLADVPEEASVSVTTYMMPNVSMREEVYRYPEGEGCDYVIFDMRDAGEATKYMADANELINDGYIVVEDIENAVLILKKSE